jgi:hypothetical protein
MALLTHCDEPPTLRHDLVRYGNCKNFASARGCLAKMRRVRLEITPLKRDECRAPRPLFAAAHESRFGPTAKSVDVRVMSEMRRRVQPVDATPSNLARGGGVRWRGLHGYGSRRSGRNVLWGRTSQCVSAIRSPSRYRRERRTCRAVLRCPRRPAERSTPYRRHRGSAGRT